MTVSLRVPTVLLLLALLTTCGGASTTPLDGGSGGRYPLPQDPAPDPSAPSLPPGLDGGVFATFTVGLESFSLWTTEPAIGQALVDAWTGAAPAITHVCADVEPGSGVADHNAPWSWSVRASPAPRFQAICLGCAFAWDTPSKAEAGILSGPPYDCDDAHAGATRAMIRMPVQLTGLVDAR